MSRSIRRVRAAAAACLLVLTTAACGMLGGNSGGSTASLEFWMYQPVLPLSKPVLAVVTITSFIFHWNDLVWPLVVINDKDLYTLPLALQQLATQEAGRAYYIMAGATLAVIPVLAVLLVFQRRILQGIAFTGRKG